MLEVMRSSETTVLTRATRRNVPEDGILYSHIRENLNSSLPGFSNITFAFFEVLGLCFIYIYIYGICTAVTAATAAATGLSCSFAVNTGVSYFYCSVHVASDDTANNAVRDQEGIFRSLCEGEAPPLSG
jgi:hypothetical protein